MGTELAYLNKFMKDLMLVLDEYKLRKNIEIQLIAQGKETK